MVLSRSQEERVLAVLQRQLPGSLPLGYCVAHLAAAAKVKPEQHVHLARFLYAVLRKGQCEILEEGLCSAGGHEVFEIIVRGRASFPAEPPPRPR
jgi:hypothetical protein